MFLLVTREAEIKMVYMERATKCNQKCERGEQTTIDSKQKLSRAIESNTFTCLIGNLGLASLLFVCLGLQYSIRRSHLSPRSVRSNLSDLDLGHYALH